MRPAASSVFACVFFLALGFVQAASAKERRVALVIGNSGYEHVSRLPNPANDAEDLGRALERLGFDVTSGLDMEYREMRLALRDFSDKATDADVALIYFAGHGIEIDKINYLIPINAELKSDRDIDFEAIRLDTVIGSLADTKGVRIVLLDACRNNPFVADMQRTTATRSIGRGLSRIDPGGVLVGYAARGGTIALDGDGRNSPYAQAILANIEEPGLEIGKLFRRVRDMVLEKTDGFQEPFTYGSLPGDDIFFVPPVEVAAVVPSAPATPPSVLEEMLDDFAQAEKYNTLTRWNSFVSQYGEMEENRLVQIALRRQADLKKEQDRRARSARRQPIFTPEFDGKGHAILDREQSKLLQEALAYMGHYSGPIDGDIGPQTRKAITTARLDAKLTFGTQVDRPLLAALPDVAAIKDLIPEKAQYFDAEDLPVGLDPRLEKALQYFDSPFGRGEILFDYFRGNLYIVVREDFGDFGTAVRKADAVDGHLVTIQSAAENQFLVDLFTKDPRFVRSDDRGTLYGPMIGLYQQPGSSEPRGGWTWVTGEPLSYTAWSPGNPDNYEGRQHRARFFLSGRSVGPGSKPRYWDDTSNTMWNLGYIIEIE